MTPRDTMPWLLLPCVLLTLGGASLLSFHGAAQASPADLPSAAVTSAAPSPAPAKPGEAYDDGDGDELLEHWGNPSYSQEARVQMEGAAAGFLLLGAAVWRKRRRTARCVSLTLVDVSAPSASENTASERRKAA